MSDLIFCLLFHTYVCSCSEKNRKRKRQKLNDNQINTHIQAFRYFFKLIEKIKKIKKLFSIVQEAFQKACDSLKFDN